VTIVGGGLSGAAIAYHLGIASVERFVEITVVEPRETLGMGLAYSTEEPTHRINVRASKMTIRIDEPHDFVDWLARPEGPVLSAETATPEGELFPQRRIFGQYVADRLRPFLALDVIKHVRASVVDIEPTASGYGLALSTESDLEADAVVLATTHPPPRLPAGLEGVLDHPALVKDPYDGGALDRIGPADDVLVIGTGLASADVIAALDARGHSGQIVALSRRGWRSQGHGPIQRASSADFATPPARTARGVLRTVRRAVRDDVAQGLTWHPALDRARAQGRVIWTALPEDERQRLLRHLRPIWDSHRFRVAPQVEAVLDRKRRSGCLTYVAGRIIAATEARDGTVQVTWRRRGCSATETRAFKVVVVTTGPAHGDLFTGDGLIARLNRSGHVSQDPCGLGLNVDERSRTVGRDGRVSETFYVGGPLARGGFGELMGVPEVTAHAEMIAAELANLAERRSSARRAS
jgi:uncharacterized NAD(P)/FAD-binding protein YdhS